MPRTRRHVDRDVKLAALLDVAETLFLERGYEGTSIADVAAGGGVTATTVYWYFTSKDDLFAAMLGRWADETLAEVEEAAASMDAADAARLAVAVLRQIGPLLGAVHERASRAAGVGELHDAFHDRLAAVVAAALERDGADPVASGVDATALVLLAEAVLSHDWAGGQDRVLLDAAVAAVTGPAGLISRRG